MKPVIVISVAGVLILIVVLAVWFGGVPDGPTSATAPKTIQAQIFPDDLPKIFTSADPQSDATELYDQAVALYEDNRDVLTKTKAHDKLVAGLCELLVRAMRAGHVEAGFMDRHIPLHIGAEPEFGDSLESIYELVIRESARRFTAGDREEAMVLAQAVWALGQRMFESNVRLYNRVVGLDMMESAGMMLYEMADDSGPKTQALADWSQTIKDIRRAWQAKMKIVLHLDPQIGDLINIALHDKDRTFRVEATLRLGLFKYAAKRRADRRAVLDAITSAMGSEDALIAEAARVADALTLEEKRRFY